MTAVVPVAPIVQAHRGLSSEHPENSIAAFRAAAEAGFAAIEMDVRLTHDDVVVVLHDAGLERTTDGHGRLRDLDWHDVERLDAGDGHCPPRLDALLTDLWDWPGHWNIEIKAHLAVPGVVKVLRAADRMERATITSMDPRALRDAQERAPDIARGLIVMGPPDLDDLNVAADHGCTWLNADHDFLDADVIARLHTKGLRVGAWTVNDPDRAVELVADGVDAIITDRADVLAAVRAAGAAGPGRQ